MLPKNQPKSYQNRCVISMGYMGHRDEAVPRGIATLGCRNRLLAIL